MITVAAPALAAPGPADARFKALYEKEWTWRQDELARSDGPEDDTLAPRLPKVDAASQAKRLAYWQDVRRQLDGIKLTDLSAQQRVNYQVYRDQIDVLINQQKFHEYEKPFNSDSSFWSNFNYKAARRFVTAADYENYISQLHDIPRYFGEQQVNMRVGLKRGWTPPKVTLVGRDVSVSATVDAKTAEDTLFWQPFKDMPASIPAAQQAALKAKAKATIEGEVKPAYATLLKFLRDEYIPGTTETLAAEALPDGKAYYQAQIREFATVDMTPEQIHTLGLSEVAKIRAQMQDVMKETGFTGDFPAFLSYLRTDPKFYPKTAQELLNTGAWISKRVDGKLSSYFGYLPRSRFTIIPVPADIAPFYTSARGGKTAYLINTYNLPSRPLYNMTALTLHESAPGHSFQGGLAEEQAGLPDFRRYVYISAYGEGWALYCEYLGLEMGMYDTPYDRFGYLTFQMWRAARLVVDTGIHHKGWSRAQAIQFLHDNTALSDHDIEIEVDRYISWPGQAVSYYLGMLAIKEARVRAEKALGPKFDIRAFHDTVLSIGSVPLPVLQARIDQFIAEGGKDPMPVDFQKAKAP
ncbi:MAG: DUF885 family protein [Alphaproteobacteria bacterium]|nr:DUF885 family protein [Alphaproteobacteria bacterium]MBU1513209.1 DUF885 family protein [Alphaproteobacteria bacterium]MBU2095317.1 DUF885 family protein [Alphaproteobacteria bacterium]MBU2152232.1 DUF885 family protein [Alphaproteobacteria bacterium]MBU2306721.1 DUF885 family protein [Alphaproteobacteria bacterium]